MNQIYTAKSSLAGQNVYCKKELRQTKCMLKEVASVDKIYIIKSSLGEQNRSCKREFMWTKT